MQIICEDFLITEVLLLTYGYLSVDTALLNDCMQAYIVLEALCRTRKTALNIYPTVMG